MSASVKPSHGTMQPAHNGPLTPPRSQADLPTPPTSHIELSQSTQPPAANSAIVRAIRVRQSSTSGEQHDSGRNADGQREPTSPTTMTEQGADQSPSVVAHSRKANRISTGSTSASANELTKATASTSYAVPDVDAERGRARDRDARAGNKDDIDNSSRSRTPSPILGSIVSSTGHLSFSAALEPSPEEVRALLYGETGEDEDASRPRSVGKPEMDDLLQRLGTMGLANVDSEMIPSTSSKEQQLASMVKSLVRHAQEQDSYIDGLEESLHNTRIRSIAMLSSLRTSFAHSFATEYELRARLEAELDGIKAQARKLSQLLARSESRNEELDRERAMSAEEEILWQEEMKGHASAYAQQQAARARAAQMAQAQGQPGRTGPSETPKREQRSPDDEAVSAAANAAEAAPLSSSPPLAAVAGLDEPFEERKLHHSNSIGNLPQSTSDGSLAGLGISSNGAVQIDANTAPAGSPLSTIIRERNKLLADKRHLKNRVRDAESQRDRLELELKSLRPLLVRGVPAKSTVASQLTATPTTPGKAQKRDRSRRRRQAMLGDAEAEHLLLAARRLQTTRKVADDDGRPTTPPLASGVSNPRTPRTPRVAQTPRSAAVLDSVTQSASSSRMTDGNLPSNASPLAGRNGSLGRWGGHERVDSARSAGGIDDLLQAAQTVLTPGERHRQQGRIREGDGVTQESEKEIDEEEEALRMKEHRILASSTDESPKRRRVSSAALEAERRRTGLPWSPDKGAFAAGRRLRTHTEGADPLLSSQEALVPQASQASALSALDLLADQAAASQQPSQSSDPSHSGEGEAYLGSRSDDSDDGMHVDQVGPNGTPNMGSHYYPRGAYGHAYAHPPLAHDGYRLSNQSGYGYGSGGSPVALSSQGWTSQTVPSGRNGIYSPPSSHQHTRFALQGGPRISSGYIANMQDGSRLAKGNQSAISANGMTGDEDSPHRTPQKGGNTSPDKRLPYVRWSEEEDQKLRRAINEFGQRWESVARVVGTRTYHQCRQRYLLMRRKEAAARDGHNGSGDDSRPTASPIS